MAFNKEKVMDAARKFVDKGQIDKAVKEYLRIVQEDPKDVRVWLKIGDLYTKKGAKQDATDTYLKVARFYHEQEFYVKAVAVYKQILKLDPRLVEVTLKLAELYRQTGYMTEAMQHYEQVAAHFHREGNTKEALDTVKKLVDLDPENIATRIKLAELYSKEGLNDEAIAQFTVACETLRRQGRQDDFLKVAERLLWHKPDSYALMRELAGLYLRRNDPRRALQKLQASFKADPRDVETLGLLAQAFQALDQKAKTVSVLKELARIHLENKHRDKASEVYKKILEFVPNDPDAIQFVGVQPVAPPKPMPVQQRQTTPIPAAIRAATGEAKFNITTDLPSIPASSRMTGSMPLVDESSLSGVDFALPEYDDADFSADMEPPPDPRRASAAGERHADEISKILAETDVYVKYGLHQKAVDHLRRVFTLDGENVEAHERLKDIFISQGREQEAEVELLKLAELVASDDPDRAEQHLQELLAMNGTHTGAFELARRYRLRVTRTSSVSAELEYQGGGVAAVDSDLELDDLELSAPPPAMAVARRGLGARGDSIDDFDPDDLIGRSPIAHGSPAPGKPPRRPAAGSGGFGSDDLDRQFDPSPSQSTRQMSPDHASALAALEGDLEDDLLADSPHAYNGDQALDNAVDQQLDDSALGDDIDSQVAAELGSTGSGAEDLPFDPDEARLFDQAVRGDGTDAIDVNGFEETDMPPHPAQLDTPSYEQAAELAVSGSYDPYGTEAVQTPPYDPTMLGTDVVDVDEADIDPPRSESTVEDELDEADFYTSQGMFPEALDVLRGLQERYPHHPLINAKTREMEMQVHGTASPALTDSGAVHTSGTEAIDLDEIEEMDDFEVVEDSKAKRKPSVMLERPVDEGDAETHYDLGLAYKEMGLYDEAIKAFDKVLRVRNREVGCRVMLGMCQREMGNPSEAINHFKAGLHAEPSERERLSLYYEIGITYEMMRDDGEALYYFEAVIKRDPSFADAMHRADTLRARGGHSTAPVDDDVL